MDERRKFEAVTEREDSHQDVAPRRGVVSCRRRARLREVVGHLMSCSSSATSASLLKHSALRTLPTRSLPASSRTLPGLMLHNAICQFWATHMDTALTIYSNAQYMFGAQHHRGNTLMAALMHRYLRDSRHGGQATKIPPVSARLEIRTRKAFLQNVWLSVAAKMGLAGRRRVGEFLLVMLCSDAQPSELLPLRARQQVPPTSSVTSTCSILIAPRNDGHCTETNLTDVSILLDWLGMPLDGKGRARCADGNKEALVVPFPSTSSGQNS